MTVCFEINEWVGNGEMDKSDNSVDSESERAAVGGRGWSRDGRIPVGMVAGLGMCC